MNIKRILIATVVLAIFNVIYGMLTCGGIFSWVYELEPTSVWKQIDESTLPQLMLGVYLFENLLFTFAYALINKGIPGSNKYLKGALYGLIVFAVGNIPGLVDTYLFMNVATTVVIYWIIWGLVSSIVKGLIVAGIYNE